MGEDSEIEIARAVARATECRTCTTRLAADQRYCVRCGTRRGALPFAVAEMVEAMVAHSLDPVPRIELEPVPAPEPEPALRIGPIAMRRLPGPQALAAMLLASLGFGVLAGSVAPAPVQALASAPLNLIVHGNFGSSNAPSTAGADNSSNSSAATPAQTQETVTVTSPAPASSTPANQGTTPSTTPTSTTPNGGGSNPNGGLLGLPPINHVFLIVMADQGYSQTFAPTSGDTYLSKTLPHQGELIEDYYGVAGSSLANGVALISGQGPTALTDFNCPSYSVITKPRKGKEGQVVGSGCVYPKTTPAITDELAKKKLTWRAYIDGIVAPCRHPLLGSADPDYALQGDGSYVTWRNPFVYFRSVIAAPTCLKNDVDLPQLSQDLLAAQTTPTFSYIVPSPCENGDATPCRTGAPAGLKPADAWLRKVVNEIKRSPAYKDGGMIAITFDHAPQGGPDADANACCNTPAYPNLPAPASGTGTTTTGTTTTGTTTTPTTSTGTGTTTTGTTTTGTTTTGTTTTGTTTTGTTTTGTTTTPTTTEPNPGDIPGQTVPTGGGGQVGLVLLTAYVKPGTVESIDYYNHFSLLATIESMFGLKRLGFASDPSLPLFDSVIFNRHPKTG